MLPYLFPRWEALLAGVTVKEARGWSSGFFLRQRAPSHISSSRKFLGCHNFNFHASYSSLLYQQLFLESADVDGELIILVVQEMFCVADIQQENMYFLLYKGFFLSPKLLIKFCLFTCIICILNKLLNKTV